MNLQDITPKWISETLQAARKKQGTRSMHQPLDCLASHSPETYPFALIDLLHGQIMHELIRFRRKYGLVPPERSSLAHKDAIEQDARQNDPRLLVWTFMYYRYISTDLSVKEVSTIAKYSADNHRLKIKQGYELLAKFVQYREAEAHAAHRYLDLQTQLGKAEYTEYVGMDESLERLVHYLRDPEGPRWISLEGLGGIGKTALARRVTEELVKQDASIRIIWLSARQQRFDPVEGTITLPDAAVAAEDLVDQLWHISLLQSETTMSLQEKVRRLSDWLQAYQAVIVVDNLETLEDVAAIRHFLPLALVARFLITTRESLAGMPSVMIYPVRQLSNQDSEILLRREYQERKTAFLKKKNPQDTIPGTKAANIPLKEKHFEQIQQLVGGFPLALKLVAAQILTMPIDECLTGLQYIAPQTRSEEMFTYIYRQTWMLLSPDARLFLLAIHDALPSDGTSIEWLEVLAGAIGLSSDQFEGVMQQLHYYSLLETAPRDQRYRLHRLTMTFLLNEFRSDEAWGQV